MKYDYLILGGGVAGHRAAEEIRNSDSDATIAIVTDEKHRLYSRVLLPHYLSGKIPREKVFLIKPEWYTEHKIDFLSGENILRVDESSNIVELLGGETINFKKLLIATGCHPRKIEIRDTTTLNFRSLDDADRIAVELKKLESLPVEKRVVGIYGTGFIAAEFINLFVARECQVHIFYRGERFWGSVLDEKSSALIETRLKRANCLLHPKSDQKDVEKFAPELQCLGVGLGVIPQTSFLGIKKIEFDETLATELRRVWIAGDVTGAGTWQNADSQGRLAGKNMLGGDDVFKLVPSQAINVIDLPVTMIGDAHPEKAEKIEVSEENGGVIQKMYRGSKLVGATLVGTASGRTELQNKIGE